MRSNTTVEDKDPVSQNTGFENAYRTFGPEIYAACLKMTSDAEHAKELTQQAFVNFMERGSSLYGEQKGVRHEKAYIMKIAENLFYTHCRKNAGVRCEDFSGECDPKTPAANFPLCESPEEIYFAAQSERERQDLARDILAQLKSHDSGWYDAVRLVICEDMPHDEAARLLGVSKVCLYGRLYRAKRWMREKFGGILREGDP